MSFIEWITTTRKGCNQWAEFFSVVAGEADPITSIVGEKALEWGAFLKENFAPKPQRKLLCVTDEGVRAQIVRAMQSVLELHKRLAQAAEAQDPSEVSEVMLSIDSALQRLAIGMNRVRAEDVDESVLDKLPELPESTDDMVTRPSPAKAQRLIREGSGSGKHPREGSGSRKVKRPGSSSGARPAPQGRPGSSSGARPAPTGRSGSSSGARPAPTRRMVPPPRHAKPTPSPTPGKAPGGWPRVHTAEDPVIPLTQKKGDSQLIKLPVDAEKPDAAARAESARGPGPLRPAATDPRVALLRTYVKRLDREVLGPEEDAALEQVLATLSGALSSSEDTLARRFRFLDQQLAADDAALFSKPLLKDLQGLLAKLAELATARLATACDQAQADRLLFIVGDVEIRPSPDELPVVQLARAGTGLRTNLLPSYLPRLRGPTAGFTFHVGTRDGAKLVRPVAENRLEFGFIAGATRLWLTALHVLRLGAGGKLNIEREGDDLPAYFEARLPLPASDDTYAVAQRFVLAETARFVDRIVSA